jgi:hypothetical protein
MVDLYGQVIWLGYFTRFGIGKSFYLNWCLVRVAICDPGFWRKLRGLVFLLIALKDLLIVKPLKFYA